MCNRFKSKLQAAQIRDLMSHDLTVLNEADVWEPAADQRPSQETLAIFARDHRLVLGTVFWGFKKLPGMGSGLVINARSERVDSSPFWRDTIACWLPVTSWIEYLQEGKRNVPHEVALPDGTPFLLAAVCGIRDGMRRMAMCMQDAPPTLAYLCNRLPLAYELSAALGSEGAQGLPQSAQIIDQMVVVPA